MFKKQCRFSSKTCFSEEELFECEKKNAWQIINTMFPNAKNIKLQAKPKKNTYKVKYAGTKTKQPRRFLGHFCSEKEYWDNIIKLAEIILHYEWTN